MTIDLEALRATEVYLREQIADELLAVRRFPGNDAYAIGVRTGMSRAIGHVRSPQTAVSTLEVLRDLLATRTEVKQLTEDNARLTAIVEAVEKLAAQWRAYQPGAFYPEASAYANGIENCGDALVDLLDEHTALSSVCGLPDTSGGLAG